MFYELQKTLTTKSYKAIDLHEFVKMCRYIDQTLRDVNNNQDVKNFSMMQHEMKKSLCKSA
jgi:hypothetical protein